MNRRQLRPLTIAFFATVASMFAVGCSSSESSEDEVTEGELRGANCGGGYCIDVAKVNRLFRSEDGSTSRRTRIANLRDVFSVVVDLGEGAEPFNAESHVFPKPGAAINIIPYADGDTFTNAAGDKMRGDEAAAKSFKPGELGFAIKHHRPMHRLLKIERDGDSEAMKESFKLQDTHIEVVVGVKKGNKNGVITVNNPQGYQDGGFGDEGTPGDYPMIFAKPVFPSYVSDAVEKALIENMRTILVGLNTVSMFPGDYNGGDPLSARDPKRVREHVRMMIKAVAGNATARKYFEKPENHIYCAELAFVASSAAMHVPLNDAGVALMNSESSSGKITDDEWTKFKSVVAGHNAARGGTGRSEFSSSNENPHLSLIELADLNSPAMKSLKPVYEYAPAAQREAEAAKLSLKPMTMADIVQNFMRTHFPREERGEAMAPVQAKVLGALKPGLLDSMGFGEAQRPQAGAARTEWEGKRAKVEELYAKIVTVVGKDHGSYQAFRAALEPLMLASRQLTGPRTGETGEGLFTPPSLFHTVLQGEHTGGLMGLKYVGHGLHVTVVKPE